MLGRAGIDAIIVDPHEVYPPELRCEKLDAGQTQILHRTGLAELIYPSTALAENNWVVRFGRLLDKRPGAQRGIMYDRLVNATRALIPGHIPFLRAKVAAIESSPDRQTVRLAGGDEVSARLVILANGLNLSLLQSLGLKRTEISRCHSITVGFDIQPVGRGQFEFPALSYYPERPSDAAAFLTLFPVAEGMRANYCTYRQMNDPWFQELRASPRDALARVMPGLGKITGRFDVIGPLKIRPVDLYQTENYVQPGIVLVGDAFATSCPAAGTGAGKALNDVERLCNVHIPAWLASAGMSSEKIGAFYADPVKQAYDAWSRKRAFDLRSLSIDITPKAVTGRWARFLRDYGAGMVRRGRNAAATGEHSTSESATLVHH
jgi:2-polyprenyl-6-methoxyphenol hydroxylase-like FAD-dependent oxidoreductase